MKISSSTPFGNYRYICFQNYPKLQIRTGKWDEETQALFCKDMEHASMELDLAPDKYLQALK